MCGIAGWAEKQGKSRAAVLRQMCDALAHRGPDDSGIYESADGKVGLGHRRLSFLDLTPAGHQPMGDKTGNYSITLNGEIYNYLELKRELKDQYTFITNTDTEVVLAAYQKWGVDMLSHLKGMFAFALLDEEKQKLLLVRDRFGIKPLYYTLSDSCLLFASELKAIFASGEVEKEMDYSAFVDYFVYRYIPSPKTIWKNCKKLPPAHYLSLDLHSFQAEIHAYWELEDKQKSTPQLAREVDEMIRTSVKEHTRADVEIGAFLSGGYDSSALVAYMKKMGQQPQTFSIGFEGWQNSEHSHAQKVAEHLNVPNETYMANAEDLRLLDVMPEVYDEPIADISIIPTYLVSQLAHAHVKAVLSGEGADELFGGYKWQHEFFQETLPHSLLDKWKKKVFPTDIVAFYAKKMAMGMFDVAELKEMLHPDFHAFIPEDIHWFYRGHVQKKMSPFKSLQYLDIKCFMGELVLTKVDRASMANSLEVRVPFLDHQLFECVFAAPEKEYIDLNQTKKLLYENIKDSLPSSILKREKQGFVGPDSYYMNISWYKEQLVDSHLVKSGIVNQAYVDKLLQSSYDWRLWKLLVMEKWWSKWMR